MYTKKVLAFDLDDTLAITKSPISEEMSQVFGSLLSFYDMCVISGGRYEQIQMQVTEQLHVSSENLTRLHIMPTCGTRYYNYDVNEKNWVLQYNEDLSDEEKDKITHVLEDSARSLDLWPDHPDGQVIEDRLSQITFSALGQQASAKEKYTWDPEGIKKMAIRNLAAESLPELSVNVGGTTSVDVTRIGIDKAYGMNKLLSELNIEKKDILFFGDKLEPGGNDYPVKKFGIESIAVINQEDTLTKLKEILDEITNG